MYFIYNAFHSSHDWYVSLSTQIISLSLYYVFLSTAQDTAAPTFTNCPTQPISQVIDRDEYSSHIYPAYRSRQLWHSNCCMHSDVSDQHPNYPDHLVTTNTKVLSLSVQVRWHVQRLMELPQPPSLHLVTSML